MQRECLGIGSHSVLKKKRNMSYVIRWYMRQRELHVDVGLNMLVDIGAKRCFFFLFLFSRKEKQKSRNCLLSFQKKNCFLMATFFSVCMFFVLFFH